MYLLSTKKKGCIRSLIKKGENEADIMGMEESITEDGRRTRTEPLKPGFTVEEFVAGGHGLPEGSIQRRKKRSPKGRGLKRKASQGVPTSSSMQQASQAVSTPLAKRHLGQAGMAGAAATAEKKRKRRSSGSQRSQRSQKKGEMLAPTGGTKKRSKRKTPSEEEEESSKEESEEESSDESSTESSSEDSSSEEESSESSSSSRSSDEEESEADFEHAGKRAKTQKKKKKEKGKKRKGGRKSKGKGKGKGRGKGKTQKRKKRKEKAKSIRQKTPTAPLESRRKARKYF